MLDRTDFRRILSRALNGSGRGSGSGRTGGNPGKAAALELHLHGGESFFLRCVKRIAGAYALCEIVPMHEFGPLDAEAAVARVPVREAVIPYATMDSVEPSSMRVAPDHPLVFRESA